MRWLAVETWGALRLVLAHWQAEPGPEVWLQGPGVPELVSDH